MVESKVHMITGSNDAVACGGTRGKRTDDLALVTCAKCGALINAWSDTEVHLIALEILHLHQNDRFVSLTTTAPKLVRVFFSLSAELKLDRAKTMEERAATLRDEAAELVAQVKGVK